MPDLLFRNKGLGWKSTSETSLVKFFSGDLDHFRQGRDRNAGVRVDVARPGPGVLRRPEQVVPWGEIRRVKMTKVLGPILG